MSGFANDGNFLAKFLTAQQRVAAKGTTDAPTTQSGAQLPQQSGSSQAQQLPPAPQQHQQQSGVQLPQQSGSSQAQQLPPAPQQHQQQSGVQLPQQSGSWAQQLPPAPQQHQQQAWGQQQPQQLPWSAHSSSVWSGAAAGDSTSTQHTALSSASYQKPADVLAAAGWRKEYTPEGLSFWVNNVTGETRETEPPKGALVVSVQRTTSAAVGTEGVPGLDGGTDQTGASPAPSPPPPPPGVSAQAAAVMTKLAARVARNSRRLRERGENENAFEELIKQKNTGDPTFSFLFHEGSIGNVYYQTLKRFEGEAGPEAIAGRKAAEAKAERRRRRWGPPTNAKESSSSAPVLASHETASATPQAESASTTACGSRGSAWDVAPQEAETANEQSEPAAIEWEGVSIGTNGWRQYTLCDGRMYYHRTREYPAGISADSGSECEVSWDRPVAKNHTKVDVVRDAAEPVLIEQPRDKLPAVGPVGGVVTRKNTGASAKDALAAAVSRKRARDRLHRARPLAFSSDTTAHVAGLGYGASALGTGGGAIAARRTKSAKDRDISERQAIDSVQEMRAQLATVEAAILRAPGQQELVSLRSNLVEAIALASAGQDQSFAASTAEHKLEVTPSNIQRNPAGGVCTVLCAMPDGTGLWCRAVTLTDGGEGASVQGRGVRVRIITPVCEDYRDREHILQPTALRPDFEIVPHDHLKEGARVLAPHSDGLWYSARVFVTTGDDVLRTRNKLNVKFDEYRDLYTVPLDEVIPRVSTHEQNDDADMAAVYKRRRREDKEKAARDAAQADEENADREGSNGIRTLDGDEGAWERHTRGIGSRLMSKMGHVPGQPLGTGRTADGSHGKKDTCRFNLTKPIEIRVLPPGRSLDFISDKPKKKKKKKEKGGYRNTSTTEDMFSFLNTNVAEATIDKRTKGIEEVPGAAVGGREVSKKKNKKKTEADLRLELVQKQRHHRELIVLQRDLKQRLSRNADAPGMHRAIQNKVDEVAAEIKASTASQNAIEQQLKVGKEKRKLSIF